ncbi:MAG TPA: CGNR zinc finger domain-containing protein [Acidimicrobiia bacterium]|nr:CGNR zinc finger domain-containing protein [Acidimicrobiia bacterium]
MLDVGTLQVHHPDGQVFTFEPGSLALAFALTGPGTYAGPLAHFQTLRGPSDLERWAVDVLGVAGLKATENDLVLAVRLQAAIWSVADALIDRQHVPDGDREVLNELAAEPCLVPRLLPGPTRTWVGGRGVRRLMSSVARDAIDVFGGPRAARLKRCDGSRCLLLFVDTSRSGRRRWCSMERCGNRSKVAAHRRRRKENDS